MTLADALQLATQWSSGLSGKRLELRLSNGSYVLESSTGTTNLSLPSYVRTHRFDAGTIVSSLDIVGERGGVTIQGPQGSTAPIFTVEAGSPPVTFRGISIERARMAPAIMVRDGSLTIEDSEFRHNPGSALVLLGGHATIRNSAFINNGNPGISGGALFVNVSSTLSIESSTFSTNRASEGGALYVNAGQVIIRSCRFTANEADVAGGALHATNGGNVALADRTQLHGNVAPMGRNAATSYSQLTYELPAPAGHWIQSSGGIAFIASASQEHVYVNDDYPFVL